MLPTTQTLQGNFTLLSNPSKSHKSYAPTSKASLPTRSHATTRYKGKEIAKPITPPSESASEEDSDPEQAQRDKDMQKNLALIAKYFKKIYKPTNNNLRTSSNTRNKNVDTTPRYKNDNQTGQFGNQRAVNVAGARETVGGQLADTDEEIDEQELEAHYSYMAKIQEVPNADSGTDAEPLEQVQYDTDDNVFANDIQHFEQSESISNTCAVETGENNVLPDSPDMCDNDIQDDQNDVECDDERVALANLIANLKLDIDENKKIQKQLKKANATLTQELTECKSILAETSRTLGESNSIRDICLVALQNKQTEFERYKAFNDRTVDYHKHERKLNETLGLLAQKEIDIKEGLKVKAYKISVVKKKHDELVKQSLLTKSHYEGLFKEKTKVITDLKLKEEKDIDKMISMENQLKFLNEIVYKRSQSIETIHMLAPKCPTFNGRPTFANPMYLKKAQNEIPCLYAIPHDQSDPCNQTYYFDREGTVHFGNDQFAPILGYGDLVQGNITINRVYYVEGLNHNLFSVGQFCDADLEVAFRKSTCFVRDLQGNDLLTGNHGTDIYIISLQETTSSTPICLMAKASPTQAWLWHQILSHLNFDYINLLSKKDVVIGLPKLNSKGRLNLLHMDLCGPMRVASINGKKYILVIVDDYSRYTWTLFLRSKDETLEVLKDFLTMIQRNLQAPVISIRTDRGTEFLNKTLNAFFKEEGIEHQTSTPRTPEQNGVVERRNRKYNTRV
ncbi:retrovirus-related pol polyprotein from transposon TNT 1-94 [Tanacetum coccineum]